MFNRYSNKKNYGFTAPQSYFKPYEAEPDEPVPIQQKPPPRRYLPGERLLQKLNKAEKKKKPLDMKTIEASISEILDSL
jgi:hypothetical protein